MEGADGEHLSAAYYHSCNRGKRSVAVDFETPEGQAIVRRLAGKADVLIENFKVGGLKKYGLDYESLKPVNPRLVYCSITGFGQTGPYAPRAGYDFIIQGMGGIMDLTGEADDEPQKPGVAFADIFTGIYAAIGVLALRRRDATGEGAHLDMALLDTQTSVLANQALNYLGVRAHADADGQRAPEHRALPGVPGRGRARDRGGRQRRPVREVLPRARASRTWRTTRASAPTWTG